MQVNRPLSFVPAEALFSLSTQTSIYLPTNQDAKLLPSRYRTTLASRYSSHLVAQGVSLENSPDFSISLTCGVKSCHMNITDRLLYTGLDNCP